MWISLKQKTGTDIVMTISGLLVIIICAVVVLGHLTKVNLFFDYHPGFIPMAPSSAILFTFYGLLLIFNLYFFVNRPIRSYIILITIILTIFGLLKFLESFIPLELTFEKFLTSHTEYLGNFPLGRMSPYTGLLFFITGGSVLLKYYTKENLFLPNLISSLGLIVLCAGFIASLGYIFRTPFLYSGNLIPLAESTAFAFMFLGFGLIALGGEKTFFARRLSGPMASARVLRTFLPLVTLGIVSNDFVDLFISRNFHVNQALVSAIATLISVLLGIIVVLFLTKRIFKSANKAEEERLKAEIQLKKYTDELKTLNDTKDKLFSIIAHDLKNPFNSILGLTQLLNDQYEEYNDDEKKLIISNIKDSSKKMFSLLENLLIWSFAQRNGINVNAEKIDLYEIANVQMGVFVTIARTKNILLANNIDPCTFVNADRDLVKTILLNLINNAIKFTHSSGNIHLNALKRNDNIEVSVTDNGVGIDAHVLKTLFKSAESYTSLGTSNEKGTGLGLMICKEFVELNGGSIWVESEEGNGSRFTFTLPIFV